MPRLRLPQNLFTQGEVGENIHFRNDIDLYRAGAKTVENFTVLPQGGLDKRRGFEYIYTCDDAVRLIPFSFSSEQEYVVVCLNTRLMIFKDDILVHDTENDVYVRGDDAGTYTATQTVIINGTTITLTTGSSVDDALPFINAETGTTGVQAFNDNGALMLWNQGDAADIIVGAGTANSGLGLTAATTSVMGSSAVVWTSAQMQEMKYAQSFDTLYIVHKDVQPKSLKRNGSHYLWTIANVSFSNVPNHNFGSGNEASWSSTRGYPRSIVLHSNRMILGGTRDLPQTIFSSVSADITDFDTSTTDDDKGFKYTLSGGGGRANIITDLYSRKSGVQVFASEGEFILDSSGSFTPKLVRIQPQTEYGISDTIRPISVDNETLFITRNGKELRGFIYAFDQDSYEAKNYTIISHHILSSPVDIAYLGSYKDSQSNYCFVVNGNGEIAVLSIDVKKEVLGWTRWTTTGGTFKNVVNVDDSLYVLVERDSTTYLEKWTESEVYLDHYYTSTSGSPQTAWTGATTLASTTVQCVADGYKHDDVVVDGSGNFTTTFAAESVQLGYGYTSTMITLPPPVTFNGALALGKPIRKVRVDVKVSNTKDIYIEGDLVPTRQFGSSLLDETVPETDEILVKRVSGISTEPTFTITSPNPFPCKVLGMIAEVKAGIP